MVNKIKRIPAGFIIVLVLSLIPLVSFVPQGLPITHDGQEHVVRIANFYSSLSEGNIIPRWAENLNWGYGHPVMMFLYPLSSYIASFFLFLGFDLYDSVKLVFATAFIISGITMYLWARNQFDEYIGIAASVLYLFAPYRFVDIYVRGAIGEHMAFVFLPLALYFVFKLFNSQNKRFNFLFFVGSAFSIALLVLSHNAMSIMFLPIIFLYSLFLAYIKSDWKNLIIFLASLVFGFLLSAFFVIPAFLEGKYTLREIVTGAEYSKRFVDFKKLIVSPWSYGGTGQFSVEIGYLHLLGILLFPITFYRLLKSKDKRLILLFGLFILFLISIFLMLSFSNFIYDIFTTLKKFQFPWRFLSLAVFSSSVITGMALLIIKSEKSKKIVILLGIIFLVFISYQKFQARGYWVKNEMIYYSPYPSTTDTGESAPIWSVRFMEYYPSSVANVISGEAFIDPLSRNSVSHKYKIVVFSDTARIRENTLYFPGWKVYVNKVPQNIEFQDQMSRGLITYNLQKGDNHVEVKFEDTKLRMLSKVISISAVFLLLAAGFFVLKHEKFKKRKN